MRNISTVHFLIVFIILLLIPLKSLSQEPWTTQKIELTLRMIGHQVLLNSGDTTSLVLPIKKEGDRYRIKFNTTFQFDPEIMVESINKVMKKSNFNRPYIVEVEECQAGDIVYSYQIGALKDSSFVPCQTRELPKACYSLLFTFLNVDQTIYKSKDIERPRNYFLLILVIIIALSGIFILYRKKRFQSKINPNIILLGKYRFDKLNAELIIEEQRIELTSKEADLLLLLHKTVNTTVEREVILNQVWGDEGDYVGRTLDVFISKLRKKLEADSSVKIVNIRGVGYKLVVEGEN